MFYMTCCIYTGERVSVVRLFYVLFFLSPQIQSTIAAFCFSFGQVSVLLGLMNPGSLLNTLGSFEAVKCLSCIFQLRIHSFLQCHLQCNLVGAA